MDTTVDTSSNLKDSQRLNESGLKVRLRELSTFFDVVRTVDPLAAHQLRPGALGLYPVEGGACYEVWGKDQRCSNCISRRVLKTKGRASKFELIGKEIFFVMTAYVEVDSKPCAIEAISKVDDSTRVDARDNVNLIELVELSNQELYTDSLTGIHNRRFYDEQLAYIPVEAVAMIDVDDFKSVNDSYGHLCGDMVLQKVAETISSSVRSNDFVTRYGGDEFVVVFPSIPQDAFAKKIQRIRLEISELKFKDYPELKVTISCGGMYTKGSTVPALASEVDKLLYQAKAHRNTAIVMPTAD